MQKTWDKTYCAKTADNTAITVQKHWIRHRVLKLHNTAIAIAIASKSSAIIIIILYYKTL